MQYVVVGAGPAGVVAAETLRREDPDGEIVLLSGESEPVYSRMAIPYLLSNQVDETGTYLRHDPDHFEKLGIRQMQGRVTAVLPETNMLNLDGAESLAYDRLLIATGSVPVKPPVDGLDQEAVHHCWTLEDSRHIARLAQPGSKVVLMGAGFIGCIIMEALVARGVDLTVLEMGDRMVPRMMDQTAGNMIRRWCIKKGVTVHTSAKVVAVEPGNEAGTRLRLRCESIDPVDADLVVVATGVRPETGFLAGSGIEIRQGIIVDEHLQSSIPGIYAAGDVCEGLDWSSGRRAVHAIQPAAVETGRLAAMNMAGRQTQHRGNMDMNVLDTLGLVSVSMGRWRGVEDGEEATLLDESGFRYIKLQFEEDRLVGAITLGKTDHVGVIRGLIQSKVRLGKWKNRLVDDPSRIMEVYLACVHGI